MQTNPSTMSADTRRQLLDQVDRFARERLAPTAQAIDDAAVFPRELYSGFAALGIFGLFVSEEHGGMGPDLKAACLVCERLARENLAFAITVSNCGDCLAPIAKAPPSDLRDRALAGILSGDLIPAFCLSEAGGGSDVAAMKMRARREGDSYILNGSKSWITSAPVADLFLIFAVTDPEAGHKGISTFLVPRATPGLTIGPAEQLLGLNSSPVATVDCADVVVPLSCRLGAEGEGFRLAMMAMDDARAVIASCALGAATQAVETAIAYARQRQQFGKPIIDHQGLGFLLSDMVSGLATNRALLASAVQAIEHPVGRRAGVYAAIAKKSATDFAMQAAIDAAQVLGANGLTRATPVAQLIRDCKALQIFEGTNQIQQWIIARELARNGLDLIELAGLLEEAGGSTSSE